METEFKPKQQLQIIIGMQAMQGWSKEKIIKWWEESTQLRKENQKQVIEWIKKNM